MKSALLILLSGLLALQLTGCAAAPENRSCDLAAEPEAMTNAPGAGNKQDANPGPSAMEEQWGIKIQGVRLSAAGYMLDFRYRVLDPEKAANLNNRRIKPHLLDEESGAKLIVPSPPKVGPLRTSNRAMADRTYFILFANPAKFVKAGKKVTVVIGDFRTGKLTVE